MLMALMVFLAAQTGFSGIASERALCEEPAVELDPDWLTYCNGTQGWITWEGTYRGTWFDLEDFYPGSTGGSIHQAAVWFFHDISHPWDTSEASISLWTGESQGPDSLIDTRLITATHMVPCLVTYDPVIALPCNFWCALGTEYSSGGWPSMLVDNAEDPFAHSYYSDDFMVWEPWNISGAYGNYFIYLLMEVDCSLQAASWGDLKTIF